MKQQLSVRTGSTISQIESGAFSVNSSSTKCYYFAKTDDSHQISEPFNIIKQGWGLDVQRLDGTKLSFQVECCEVSTYCCNFLPIYTKDLQSIPFHSPDCTVNLLLHAEVHCMQIYYFFAHFLLQCNIIIRTALYTLC